MQMSTHFGSFFEVSKWGWLQVRPVLFTNCLEEAFSETGFRY
jgi:hypothetical protein